MQKKIHQKVYVFLDTFIWIGNGKFGSEWWKSRIKAQISGAFLTRPLVHCQRVLGTSPVMHLNKHIFGSQ